jgi:hypothetical protein
MAKPESLPENAATPEQKPVRPFNGAENAKKVHEAWGKLKKTDDQGLVSIPGSRRSVKFSKVLVEDKKLSIWVGDDTDREPDFVVVNPPTESYNAEGVLIEDPLTAIALLIDGATK